MLKYMCLAAGIVLTMCQNLHADETDWKQEMLVVCAEDAGWPPFSFPPRHAEESFRGFNQDVLERIFGAHGIRYVVKIKPWKRCLQDGISGEVHIVLDAARNPQREKDYLLSNHIYSLTPSYLMSVRHDLAQDESLELDQLRALKVCGQKGYTYNNFGFENARVEQVSKDLPKVMELTRLGRCDVGLAREEVLRMELKTSAFADELVVRAIPGATKENFYWLINRKFSYAPELKQHIDAQMLLLSQSGITQSLLKQYF